MSCLLYCVFPGRLPAALEIPEGVEGQRVFIAHDNRLGAALSELRDPHSPPDLSNLLAYETVVESFHRHATVIPLRYGCVVQGPAEAVGLLRNRREAYETMLHQLNGLTEMGIQVLLEAGGEGPGAAHPFSLQNPCPFPMLPALPILPPDANVM